MNATAAEDAPELIPEAEVVPDGGEGQRSVSRSLAKVSPPPVSRLAVTPDVGAPELKARLDVIQAAMTDAMVDGVDYGLVPGVSKPTLLKPGAEKLGVLFQLDIQLVNDKTWGPGDHLTVESRAIVSHAPTGTRVGFGEGLCTTREKKYTKRKQDRACPECGAHAILESRKDDEPGFFCWRKREGCGKNFAADDKRITEQPVGEIENPDLPDLWNTVVKMAEKRARVDAVLAVTGASALFTQDVEDKATAAVERQDAGPKYGPAVSEDQLAVTRTAIGYLFDPENPVDAGANPVGLVLNAIEGAGGYLPHFALQSITRVAAAVKQRRENGDAAAPGTGDDPAAETQEEREERERAEGIMEQEQAAAEGTGVQEALS